jgi:LPS export ABC transporter protein LptC
MLVVLSALAAASYFLVRDEPAGDADIDATLPDGYYLTDAVLSTTDDSGIVRYQLRASRIDHQPNDGVIALSELELDYGNDKNLWRVSAQRGLMPRSGDQIALSGEVTTTLQSAAAHGATQMVSDYMDVDIAGETATTDAPVIVRFVEGELRAVGLDVDLANETITLRSNVQGVFEAPAQ